MRLIKLKEVMTLTSLARSTIYKYMSEDQFPKAVSLGCRSVAWVEEEVTDWVLERIGERDNVES
ncbi:transcriptional regulator [Vibrio astriarenae]|nr:transcriptional regulator [Vibrio sp. C7]